MTDKNYLLPGACYTSCIDGTCKVFIAGQTNLATVYDPISDALLSQPLNIDANGFLKSFVVSSDYNYDVKLYNNLGDNIFTIRDISLVVASGTTDAPQGDKGDKGDKGDTGTNGTNGVSLEYISVVNKDVFYKTSDSASTKLAGTINVQDGTDGISLSTIQLVDDKVYYSLSNNPSNYILAGTIPGYDNIGQVKATSGSPLIWGNDLISVSGDISASKDNNGTLLVVDNSEIKADIADLDLRVTALEDGKRDKVVLYGGTAGGTSVTIPHTLGTSNLGVTCYDTVNGGLIFLNVVVTDAYVSITDIAPLQSDNQIKIVLIK